MSAAASGIVATAVAGGLSSCETAGRTGSPTSDARVPLPAYVPFSGVKPDIPSVTENALDGYLQYPAHAVTTVQETPGRGGAVRACIGVGPTPTPYDRNRWWQHVNQQLGIELNLNLSPTSNYSARLATLLAGDDLPDIMQLSQEWVPRLADVLSTKFMDLTQFLSSDAIKSYPNLANIPTDSWRNVVFNGGIYGVPFALRPAGNSFAARADILEQLGITADPQDSREFLELCKAVTDQKSNRWAMSQPSAVFLKELAELPNQWRIDDSARFIKDIETDEWRVWLDFVSAMWRSGLFHPDSFASPNIDQLFLSRRIGLREGGGNGLVSLYPHAKLSDKDYRIRFLPPIRFHGGGVGRKHLTSGMLSFAAFKRADPDRVQELLRITNWCSGPFGTSEYLSLYYGVEGTDYTLEDDDPTPVVTKVGQAEKVPFNYIGGRPNSFFSARHPEVVRAACAHEASYMKDAIPLPTLGLYSTTDNTAGARLKKFLDEKTSEIIQGRQPASSWGDVVTDWRKLGGDQIRNEFMDQHEKFGTPK